MSMRCAGTNAGSQLSGGLPNPRPPPPHAPLCRLFLHESSMLALPCPPLQSLLFLNIPPKFPFLTIISPWPGFSSWPSCVFEKNSHVTHVTDESCIPKSQETSLQQLLLLVRSCISQADSDAVPVRCNSKFVVQIYSKTRLNIHPCLYDAYGMTVVEAASQGGHLSKTSVLRARRC